MSAKKQASRSDKANAKHSSPKLTPPHLNGSQQQSHPAALIQRARLAPSSLMPQGIQQLQRTLGNQVVGRLLAEAKQPQPTPGERNDLIQRALILDGENVTDYNQLSEETRTRIEKSCEGKLSVSPEVFIEQVIGELSDYEEQFTLSLNDLLIFIPEVSALYNNYDIETSKISGTDMVSKIAKRMRENDEESPRLGKRLHNKKLGLTGRKARALNQFLDTHPRFEEFIKQDKKLKLIFNSAKAKGIGGMYEGGNVYLEDKVGKETNEVFMRTLVHEMGHGTFQQLLLKGQLDESFSKGKLGELKQQHQNITIELGMLEQDTTNVSGGRRKLGLNKNSELQIKSEKMVSLNREKDQLEQKLRMEMAKFTEDGKIFYTAWQVLRQNNGQYLLGVDLGSVMPAEDRKIYQAATFEEFCAESFMHMAKEGEALIQHIRSIISSEEVPEEVKNAWRNVTRILHKYKYIILEYPK